MGPRNLIKCAPLISWSVAQIQYSEGVSCVLIWAVNSKMDGGDSKYRIGIFWSNRGYQTAIQWRRSKGWRLVVAGHRRVVAPLVLTRVTPTDSSSALFGGVSTKMRQRGRRSHLGWFSTVGDFGAERAMVSLFTHTSAAVQAHGKDPPMTRSRKTESWQLLKLVVGSVDHER
jgi:hypothetical protein